MLKSLLTFNTVTPLLGINILPAEARTGPRAQMSPAALLQQQQLHTRDSQVFPSTTCHPPLKDQGHHRSGHHLSSLVASRKKKDRTQQLERVSETTKSDRSQTRYQNSGCEGLSRKREVGCRWPSCCLGGLQGRFRGAGDTDDSDQSVYLGVMVISNGLGLPRWDMTTGWYWFEYRRVGASGPTVTDCTDLSVNV